LSFTYSSLIRAHCYNPNKTEFVKDVKSRPGEINFYDSNTGRLLFTAPKGRSLEEFLVESRAHGWPSFRGTSYD